nr:MAG TPA: hypothetical protein [Caudoviricetes sp.]DAY57017.1 MAG TPA: hypothetical protein [Caudoviricetes sp.]
MFITAGNCSTRDGLATGSCGMRKLSLPDCAFGKL